MKPQPKQHRLVACETGKKNRKQHEVKMHPYGGTGFMPNYLTPGIRQDQTKLRQFLQKTHANKQM